MSYCTQRVKLDFLHVAEMSQSCTMKFDLLKGRENLVICLLCYDYQNVNVIGIDIRVLDYVLAASNNYIAKEPSVLSDKYYAGNTQGEFYRAHRGHFRM